MALGTTISTILSGIKLFKTLHDFYSSIKTKAINRIAASQLHDTISSNFFNGSLKQGSTITTEGFLSRYSNLYYPQTYSPTIPGVSSEERGMSFKDGKLVGKAQQTTRYQLFQIPVQVLPELPGEHETFNVCFLYPNSFKSFILTESIEKKNERRYEDHLSIEESNQPIPVLVPSEYVDQVCEQYVKITGTISSIPEEFGDTITSGLNLTMRDFSYKYFRPFSPRIGFCIDCRSKTSSDFNVRDRINNLHAAIYIESHFQDFYEDALELEMRSAIPDVLRLVFSTAERPEIMPYCTTGSIRVIRRAGNTYGFYAEADLVSQEDLEVKLKKLHAAHDSFRKKAQQIIRDKTGKDFKFKPDFIYDYRRQKLFHPDGVLSSKEVELILEQHNSTRDTIDWLRQ